MISGKYGNSRLKGILPSLALAAVLVPYGYILFKYSPNIPYYDDYGAVLGFLNKFIQTNGLRERLDLLFSQWNEHRIFFDRIVALCQYKIYGRVNFTRLIIFGNIGWFLAAYVLYREFRSSGLTIGYFLPVMLIMFNLTHWESMLWAMCSIQFYYGVFFPLASLYVLIKRPDRAGFALSLFLMAMSVFTSSSGFALFPVIFLFLLSGKRYRQLLIFFFISALLLFVYFIVLKYATPPYSPVFTFMERPAERAAFNLLFLGNNILPTLYGAAIAGLTFILVFVYLVSKGLYKEQKFVFWAVVWIFLISLEVTIGRYVPGENDIGFATTSRYSVFSALLASFLYIAILAFLKGRKETLNLKKFSLAAFAFSFMLYTVSYTPVCSYTPIWKLSMGSDPLAIRQLVLRCDRLETKIPFYITSPTHTTDPSVRILSESERLGIFRMEE